MHRLICWLHRLPARTLVVGILGSVLAGCGSGRDAVEGQAAPSESPRSGDRSYPLVGEVVRIDRDSGTVAIRHEEIPGYMPPMTMPFRLGGQEVLDELQVGDEVEGRLAVGEDTSALEDLNITRPAIAQAAAIEPAGTNTDSSPHLRRLRVGEPVPDFAVTTQDGETRRLSDLREHVIALTFIYTRCPLPDFCPRIDRKFKQLSDLGRMLPADAEGRVRLLSISFDPEHDTPEVLARHAAMIGARPPLWTFAVASHDEIARVAEPLGLSYGPTPDEIIHNLVTAVIGPDGRLLRLETGGDWNPEDLYRTIAQAAAGARNEP